MPAAPLQLTPSKTAFLMVECQNGIVGDGSALPELAKAAQPILPNLGRLTRGLREAGVQVMHLTYVPQLHNRSSNRASKLFEYVLDLMADWTPDHHATQVVDEIGVGPGDLVLPRASGMSPTYRTEVFTMLRNAGYDTVILGGVSLNVAIPVVAAQAVDEAFRVVVPRDGVAGTPAEHGESMLKYTVGFLATVTTVTDILAAIR